MPSSHATSGLGKFKVLIVGGSVAGLGLANILEKYNIDYELVEKHRIIAPQLGASIAMFSSGQRILEQIGCLDTILSHSSGMNKSTTFDSQGRFLTSLPDFGSLLEAAYVFSPCSKFSLRPNEAEPGTK